MIVPAHLRMARAGLGINASQLAEMAGVAESTIQRFEAGRGGMQSATLERVEAALMAAGVRFINEDEAGGPGIRLTRRAAR